jgi:rRNA-processing protein FCF1
VKVKVVVDTNFLLTMAQGVIAPSSLNDAINASYELVTTDAVVKELETMSKREDLLAREAGFALKLLERLGVQVLRVKAGSADESILTLAKELVQNGDRVVVATNDKNLRRSVRRLGVPTLYLREEGLRLEIDWNPLL